MLLHPVSEYETSKNIENLKSKWLSGIDENYNIILNLNFFKLKKIPYFSK